jgi:hypothetical protein
MARFFFLVQSRDVNVNSNLMTSEAGRSLVGCKRCRTTMIVKPDGGEDIQRLSRPLLLRKHASQHVPIVATTIFIDGTIVRSCIECSVLASTRSTGSKV